MVLFARRRLGLIRLTFRVAATLKQVGGMDGFSVGGWMIPFPYCWRGGRGAACARAAACAFGDGRQRRDLLRRW